MIPAIAPIKTPLSPRQIAVNLFIEGGEEEIARSNDKAQGQCLFFCRPCIILEYGVALLLMPLPSRKFRLTEKAGPFRSDHDGHRCSSEGSLLSIPVGDRKPMREKEGFSLR